MPKQKYYYAIKDPSKGGILFLNGKPMIYSNKKDIEPFFRRQLEIIPITADSLHKLILSHTNKKAR